MISVNKQLLQAIALGTFMVSVGFPLAARAADAVFATSGMLATADVGEGQEKAHVCLVCHNAKKGAPNKIGPNLWGVVGRAIGTEPGFHYSAAFEGMKGKTWTYENLNEYIYSPQGFIPGNKMPFSGIKDTQERADVIAWLRTLADSPLPLPKK